MNALGHAHPRIVKVIQESNPHGLFTFQTSTTTNTRGRLAERLCQLSGLDRVFFSNSGTEAMEGAIKLARLAGNKAGGDSKSHLVALQGSYHGRTFGAMSLTGQEKYRKGFEPMLEDVTFVAQNDVEALRNAVSANTCAIVLEPIFGEGGILECSDPFLRTCRSLADKHHAALVFDEIQCGLGRTGKIFAFQSLLASFPTSSQIAKPIAAGVPLGAFLSKQQFASAIGPGQHGTTFGGGPLACRLGLEYLAIPGGRTTPRERHQSRRLYATAVSRTGVEVCGGSRIVARARIYPRSEARDSRPSSGRAGPRRRSTLQRDPRYSSQIPSTICPGEKHVDKGIKVLKKLLGRTRKTSK